MTDETADVARIAASLTKAQRRALLAMTSIRQFPARETFTAGAAWGLSDTTPRLVERVNVLLATERSRKYRDAYFATPLGIAVRNILTTQEQPK